MYKIYLMVALGALILGAFFYGQHVADAKCRIEHLQQNSQIQEQSIKQKKEIHETVYKTGVADIRRILLDKYTIAE